MAKSNNWNAGEAKGVNAPKLRFQGGQSATLNLTLILDTTDEGSDVTEHTNKLLDLMKVKKDLPAADAQRNSARPPWVQFRWGSLHSFKAVAGQTKPALHLLLQRRHAAARQSRPQLAAVD